MGSSRFYVIMDQKDLDKIRKIKKRIKKGKAIKSLVVNSRENIAGRNFRNQLKILDEEKVPSKQKGLIIKSSKDQKHWRDRTLSLRGCL